VTATLSSNVNRKSADFEKNTRRIIELLTEIKNEEQAIHEGGGAKAIESQHKKGRLTARERIAKLIDPGRRTLNLASMPRSKCMRNGAALLPRERHRPGNSLRPQIHGHRQRRNRKSWRFFPMTAKKVIRAPEHRPRESHSRDLPGRSAGIFLPLQEDVFPDTDDFGRVFRNNAVMSAVGIPQITAVMGMCVAAARIFP